MDLSLGIADMFQRTLDQLFGQFFKLLDEGYEGAIIILETIFGTKFPSEVKDRAKFTMSVLAVVIIAFAGKSSYALFTFASGVS